MSFISGALHEPDTTANTGTFSLTVPANAKLTVIVVSGYYGTAGYFSGRASFRIGSTEMSCPNTDGDSDTGKYMGCLFYLIDPPTGSQTVTWDWAGTSAAVEKHAFLSAHFTDTVSGARANQGDQLSGVTDFVSASIGASSGDLVIAGAWAFNTSDGGTKSWTGNNVTAHVEGWGALLADMMIGSATATGSQTVSATYGNSTEGGIIGVALIPTAGATNTDYSPAAGAAALAGQLPVVNPQYSRPSADVSDGGWTPSTGSDLYAVLDEATRDDADYIISPTNPTGAANDTCTVKLATISDPGVDTGFQVQWAASATGATGTVVGSLRQGNAPGTEIAAWTHSGLPVGSYQTFGDEVTSAQAANITDFSDLYFRIVAS